MEIAIKVSIGKLELAAPLEIYYEAAQRLGISILPISREAVLSLQNLPFNYKDPFDRLLIATAYEDNYTLVSADSAFGDYQGLQVLWNHQ